MLLGVDVGGTFTDAVLLADGRLFTAKAPTTPADESEGVLAAIEEVLARAGARAEQVTAFSHGMTVATNALLEGRAATTALLATDGFTDIVALARQDRPELYRLCSSRPAPLVPDELRFGVRERMTPDGPLVPLTDDHADALAAKLAELEGLESAAVVLLHSYRHPEHERRLGETLARRLPALHISLSHQTVGTFREFERAATTEIDASLSPLLGGYLRRLAERCRQGALPEPAIMQSNGGLIDLTSAAGHAAWTVLSGPAGGAAGAAFVARAAGAEESLCLDMGGTSCDVCVISGGQVEEEAGAEIAGRPIALPTLAIHTVGAGGGSIAWRDPGGALRVGPRSAGADPGPACYGRGGDEPTVTDANLVLGYLSDQTPLAGGVALDARAAHRAIGELARDLGMDVAACAEGILRVAGTEMAAALRVVTVQRGIDPRDYALLAFGGAGPLHATRVAGELGIDTILCPVSSGVLAALGLVVSDRRRDVQRSLLLSGEELTAGAIRRAARELGERASAELGDPAAQLAAVYEMRYRGQSFELPVSAGLDASPQQLREGFETLHADRYGYADPGQPLELITLRVTATSPATDLEPASPGGPHGANSPELCTRRAILGGGETEIAVIRGSPPPGFSIEAPAVVELAESTVLVTPGWGGRADEAGTIRLERRA